MKQQPQWIHRADDERGLRKVYLDGREIKQAVYADAKQGIVERYRLPLSPDSDGNLLTETLHGHVEVVEVPE